MPAEPHFRNLAGVPGAAADRQVAAELAAAGVPAAPVVPAGEVVTALGGGLGGYQFRRAWRYWVVTGPVPLAVAEALYADPVGRAGVRVAGHCGCPPPGEWARWLAPDGAEVVPPAVARDALALVEAGGALAGYAAAALRAYHVHRHPPAYPGVRGVVDTYHVDTPAGLRLLADALGGDLGGDMPTIAGVAPDGA